MITRQPPTQPAPPTHRVPLPTCWQCPAPRRASRRAFTLTELLMVIAIIGMLAGMTLGALYSARETARINKTKATITKLDEIIQAKYAEFFTRRMRIPNRRMAPTAMAELRLRVLHEIMRMEMPDRFGDITWPRALSNTGTGDFDMVPLDSVAYVYPVASFTKVEADIYTHTVTAARDTRYWIDMNGVIYTMQPDPTVITSLAGMQRTSLGKRYWRQLYNNLPANDMKFDSAECLYMIIQADPEARERFNASEIGDADGDGLMEFHDAWERPIMFLRWAPGFYNESELMTGDALNDPDPMNPRRVADLVNTSSKWERPSSIASFRLVPLIYSGGPDKKFGLNIEASWRAQFAPGDSMLKIWLDGATIGEPVGSSDPEYGAHLDNIHNHSLGMNE